MIKPIKPSEVVAKKKEITPEEVIDATNELIAMNWNGSKASFTLSSLKDKIKEKLSVSGKDSATIKTKWLDIEPIYREEGWRVHYDSPGYNESYDAYFEFTAK